MFGWLKAAVNRLTFSRHRNLALIADWLAGALWLIDATFLNLAKKAYGGNAVVYACIRLLANSISEAPLKSYTEDPDGTRTELDKQHPLNLLIKRPNELMTEYEFWELTTIHISIAGHAFYWKERAEGGQTIALWPLRPDRVGPIYSDADAKPGEKVLAGWSYQDPGTGNYIPVPRRDMLAFNFPDPADESGGIVEGLGPIQVLSAEVSADNEATSFVGALLKNYATPSMMIKLKTPVQNEDQAAMVKAKAAYEFGSGNRGKVGLVDGEADVVMTGFSLQQLEFPDLRDVAESRIAAVIGVPPVLVGLKVGLKSASIRANFGEARQYFAETTITNYWRRYQDQWTNDVAAEFGDNIVCAFDTSNVRALAGQRVERIKPIKDGFTDGAVTVNEYRAELGLPALAGGDVRRVPTNVVEMPVEVEEAAAKAMGLRYLGPGHTVAVRAADPRDDDEARLQDALAALFEKQRPDVARKIANDQPVSDDELAEALRVVMQPELTKTAAGEIGRIGAQIQVQFDPAIGNVAAADWAKQYSYGLVKNITGTTRKVISQAIDDFTRTPGMTVGQLSTALEATGFGRVRAEMIAITETTRSYTAASTIYKDELAKSGIKMLMRWHTAGDERVCPVCGPLDNKLETEWGDYSAGPPAHVRCRCATSLSLAPKPKAPVQPIEYREISRVKDVSKFVTPYDNWGLKDTTDREVRALTDYKAFEYKTVNKALRGGYDYPSVAQIDSALSRAPAIPGDVKLYRGVAPNAGFDNLKPGTIIKDKGYVSTTFDRKLAAKFGHVIEIRARQGSRGAFIDYFGSDEWEMLLPRNATFRVVSDSPSKTVLEYGVE